MKTKLMSVGAGAALAFLALTGHAQTAVGQSQTGSSWYGELGYQSVGVSFTDGVDVIKADPSLLMGTVGYRLHPNVAIEAFAGFGLQKDDIAFNGANTGVRAKASNSYGLFIKPSVFISDAFEVFGRVGVARSKLTVSYAGLSASDSDSDTAWGIGANYHFSRHSYLQWGWTQFYDKDGLDAKGWSLSFGQRF